MEHNSYGAPVEPAAAGQPLIRRWTPEYRLEATSDAPQEVGTALATTMHTNSWDEDIELDATIHPAMPMSTLATDQRPDAAVATVLTAPRFEDPSENPSSDCPGAVSPRTNMTPASVPPTQPMRKTASASVTPMSPRSEIMATPAPAPAHGRPVLKITHPSGSTRAAGPRLVRRTTIETRYMYAQSSMLFAI
jgi:hypothetical protein